MVEKSKLDEDKEGKAVDPSHYHAFGVDAVEKIKKNTKCVSAAYEELTAAKHKLKLKLFKMLLLLLTRSKEMSKYLVLLDISNVDVASLRLKMFKDVDVVADA
nr:hypothetical protein [Tanacetum cinerariifolium]